MKLKNKVTTAVLTAVTLLVLAPKAKAAIEGDGQIVAILTTANKAEIAAAKTAEKKATNKDVKAFAEHMVSEHSKNQQQGDTLAKKLGVKPMSADEQARLQKDADTKIADLNLKSGKDFDKAYIDSQVDMHTKVLADLETALIPYAKNAEMKSFLETTRTHVATHLENAKKLQAALAK